MANKLKGVARGLVSGPQCTASGARVMCYKHCLLLTLLAVAINFILAQAIFPYTLDLCNYYIHSQLRSSVWGVIMIWRMDMLVTFFANIIASGISIILASIVCAPLYSFLATYAQAQIHGNSQPLLGQGSSQSWPSFIVGSVLRMFGREFVKWVCFAALWAAGWVITSIPFVDYLAPLIWLLITAWTFSLNYLDYVYDQNDISFIQMSMEAGRNLLPTLSLGLIFCLLMLMPYLNYVLPPLAVCAATQYFMRLRNDMVPA